MKAFPSCLAASWLLVGLSNPAIAVDDGTGKCRPLLTDARKNANSLAVTLAGGGTKASSFSMGVLAALASDTNEGSIHCLRCRGRCARQF